MIPRLGAAFLVFLGCFGDCLIWGQPAVKPKVLLTIDASKPAPAPETGYLQLGSESAGKSPDGHVLSVNSRYLLRDGQPWLPVMGEFHFTRYPERYWEEEILKMKAGGIQIVSTYVFWIHHEEVEGEFDWSGRRNLREFVQLCAKHGLYVYPRIGPWAHGEVRNGGLPDWLLKKGPTRVNDPVYLSYVKKYYDEIGRQLQGLLWKEGGPVIGIQLENEYSNRTPEGGAAHISKLKSLAIEAGLDVPLYTVTGWDNAVYPARDVIPVFGGYPDEFWSGSLQDLPPDPEGVYQFHVEPAGGGTGILQGASEKADSAELWHYPRFTAELGGGMEVAYHRRPVISADDIAPMALVQLGAGVNLLGYYMFHGGTNPPGKLTTLQESQATDYPNDLPVKSYDFQAPLREFGEMSGSFRKLKVIHQFVADFGSYLAPMTAVAPEEPSGKEQAMPRVVARTQGNRGFLFFNNYVRNAPLPEWKGVQVALKLESESITVPRRPFDIPSQASFFWPVNLDLGGALLKYATAEPFAKLEEAKAADYFFVASAGITPEFAFAQGTFKDIRSKGGKISREDGRVYVDGLTPSTGAAINLRTASGKAVRIVLLSPEQAVDLWKISVQQREYMLLTPADVFVDGDTIHLRGRRPDQFSFSILPAAGEVTSGTALRKTGKDGEFVSYAASVAPKEVAVTVEKVKDAAPSSPVKMGKAFNWRPAPVAAAPDDADFEKAAVWKITVPKSALDGLSDLFLDIDYAGDVGRLYEGARLLDDNFFNGTTWEVGLKRFAPEALTEGLELKVLPLRRDAPIYMPKSSWPDFNGSSEISEVKSISASPEYEVQLTVRESSSHQ